MKASLKLDKRYARKDTGKYSISVFVYKKQDGKKIYKPFPTGYHATEAEFAKIQSGRVSGKLLEIRNNIVAIEARAIDIIKDSPFLTVSMFSTIFTNSHRSGNINVKKLFDEEIALLEKSDSWSSANIYGAAMRRIVSMRGEGLTLDVIDKDFLVNLERDMKLRPATVASYMSCLSKIFNIAIKKKLISSDLYPFGDGGYVIPNVKGRQNALSKEAKDKMLNYKPENKLQEVAHDAWVFSFYCNGMNMKDILSIPVKKMLTDNFSYYRAKTINSQNDPVLIRVIAQEKAREIAKKYGGEYVFNQLKGDESKKEAHHIKRMFTKQVNRGLAQIQEKIGLNFTLTHNVARHTLTMTLVRSGMDIRGIRDVLGHSSIYAVESYLQTINTEELREYMVKIAEV